MGNFFESRPFSWVKKPLLDVFLSEFQDWEKIKTSIQYERFQIFCFFCGRIGHIFTQCDVLKNSNPPKLSRGNFLYPESLGIYDKSQPYISFHQKLLPSVVDSLLLAINQEINFTSTMSHKSPTLMACGSSNLMHPTVPIYTKRVLLIPNSQPQIHPRSSHNISTVTDKQDGMGNNVESKNKPQLISTTSDILQGLKGTMSRQNPIHLTKKSKEKDKKILTINAKGGLPALLQSAPPHSPT